MSNAVNDPLEGGVDDRPDRTSSGSTPGASFHAGDPDLSSWFAEASTHLNRDQDEQITWDRVLEQVLKVVPGHWSGITLRRRRGRLETVAASDDLVCDVDELQQNLGEGPGLGDAVEEVGFLCRDTEQDRRWPRWGPAVAALGIRSVVSLQLVSHLPDGDTRLLGTINVYDSRRNAFTTEDLDRGLVYATHAAQAMATARQLDGLATAIGRRHSIGLAQGILMERYDLTEGAAFDALQRYANDRNMKMRDVARQVVDQQRACKARLGARVPSQASPLDLPQAQAGTQSSSGDSSN